MPGDPRTEAGRALLRSDFDTTGWGPRLVREHVTKAVLAIEAEAAAINPEVLARALHAALELRGADLNDLRHDRVAAVVAREYDRIAKEGTPT